MMRFVFTICCIWVTLLSAGQSLTDKYLHYTTARYWDTIRYQLAMDYYYENNNGMIIKREYPVLRIQYAELTDDDPPVVKEHKYIRQLSGPSFRYIRNGSRIHIEYFDSAKQIHQYPVFSLLPGDTIHDLPHMSTLENKDGISVSGYSIYLGQEQILIGQQYFAVYRFLEDYNPGYQQEYSRKEIMLDQQTLIPVKIITRYIEGLTGVFTGYSAITELSTTGMELADYTKANDSQLILYENKNTVWTEKQRQQFLSYFPAGNRDYATCLLQNLDGHLSFFEFWNNPLFRLLEKKSGCK